MVLGAIHTRGQSGQTTVGSSPGPSTTRWRRNVSERRIDGAYPDARARDLREGYAVRAPEAGELRAALDLIWASDRAEYGVADLTEEELRADWEDPLTDRWVVTSPAGEIVGYGSLSGPDPGEARDDPARFDVERYVLPDHTGPGMGGYLLRLAETRVRERLALAPAGVRGAFMTDTVNGANAAALRLLEDEGYAPSRHFLRMEIDPRETPGKTDTPPRITVRPCPSRDEKRAAFEAVEEAFRDHWGHVAEQTLRVWRRRRDLAGSGPGLWLVGRAGDEVVGAVFCDLSPGGEAGEIEWLAVRRPWRRRGVGLILLRAAFSGIRARGGRRAGLVVDSDSPTGAGRLYKRAGMRVVRHYAVYCKRVHREEPTGDQPSVPAKSDAVPPSARRITPDRDEPGCVDG